MNMKRFLFTFIVLGVFLFLPRISHAASNISSCNITATDTAISSSENEVVFSVNYLTFDPVIVDYHEKLAIDRKGELDTIHEVSASDVLLPIGAGSYRKNYSVIYEKGTALNMVLEAQIGDTECKTLALPLSTFGAASNVDISSCYVEATDSVSSDTHNDISYNVMYTNAGAVDTEDYSINIKTDKLKDLTSYLANTEFLEGKNLLFSAASDLSYRRDEVTSFVVSASIGETQCSPKTVITRQPVSSCLVDFPRMNNVSQGVWDLSYTVMYSKVGDEGVDFRETVGVDGHGLYQNNTESGYPLINGVDNITAERTVRFENSFFNIIDDAQLPVSLDVYLGGFKCDGIDIPRELFQQVVEEVVVHTLPEPEDPDVEPEQSNIQPVSSCFVSVQVKNVANEDAGRLDLRYTVRYSKVGDEEVEFREILGVDDYAIDQNNVESGYPLIDGVDNITAERTVRFDSVFFNFIDDAQAPLSLDVYLGGFKCNGANIPREVFPQSEDDIEVPDPVEPAEENNDDPDDEEDVPVVEMLQVDMEPVSSCAVSIIDGAIVNAEKNSISYLVTYSKIGSEYLGYGEIVGIMNGNELPLYIGGQDSYYVRKGDNNTLPKRTIIFKRGTMDYSAGEPITVAVAIGGVECAVDTISRETYFIPELVQENEVIEAVPVEISNDSPESCRVKGRDLIYDGKQNKIEFHIEYTKLGGVSEVPYSYSIISDSEHVLHEEIKDKQFLMKGADISLNNQKFYYPRENKNNTLIKASLGNTTCESLDLRVSQPIVVDDIEIQENGDVGDPEQLEGEPEPLPVDMMGLEEGGEQEEAPAAEEQVAEVVENPFAEAPPVEEAVDNGDAPIGNGSSSSGSGSRVVVSTGDSGNNPVVDTEDPTCRVVAEGRVVNGHLEIGSGIEYRNFEDGDYQYVLSGSSLISPNNGKIYQGNISFTNDSGMIIRVVNNASFPMSFQSDNAEDVFVLNAVLNGVTCQSVSFDYTQINDAIETATVANGSTTDTIGPGVAVSSISVIPAGIDESDVSALLSLELLDGETINRRIRFTGFPVPKSVAMTKEKSNNIFILIAVLALVGLGSVGYGLYRLKKRKKHSFIPYE